MPRRGSGYGRGSLGISEGIGALIALQEDRKERKMRELAEKVKAEMAKAEFAADEEWRQYVKDRDTREAGESDFQTMGAGTSYGTVDPTGQFQQQGQVGWKPGADKPGKWKTIETDQGLFQVNEVGELRPMEFEGQRLTKTKKGSQPQDGYSANQQREDKRTEEIARSMAKVDEAAWATMPWDQKQQWINHVKNQAGSQNMVAPTITETQPFIDKQWPASNQEAQAETTFIDPRAPMGKQAAPQGQPQDDLEAAREQLRAEGFTEEQIERAIQKLNATGR